MAYTLIAHRSGPGKYPEQSIFAARYALACGADMVEMDISYTADRVPVICHDPNTKRMFGADSLVSQMTLKDFLSLRHVSDPAYPTHTAEDVFRCGIAPVLFHFKLGGDLLGDTVERIKAYDYCRRVVLGVLHPEDIRLIRSIAPSIRVLAFMKKPAMLDEFVDAGADIIRLWEEWVSQEAVDRVHQAGRQVWVMAGDSAQNTVGYTTLERINWWRDIKADGVLVNDIPWARNALGLAPCHMA